MEFLTQNLLQTTTQIVVNSSTITAANLLNPDVRFQYVSDSFNNDATTTTIQITFSATQTIDRIALQEFNGEKFNVYYNGVTANAFTLTSPTTTSYWVSNTAENIYMAFSPIAVSSINLDIYSTQSANQEKAIGYLYVGSNELTFERVPNSSSYTPTKEVKEIIHTLADGGTRRHVVQQKWKVGIKYKYISESFRNSLQTCYESLTTKVFVPFGTGTGWDGILFEAVWAGRFDFYKYSDDATVSGFTGSIDLRET